MSFLRRRLAGDASGSSSEPSREPTPDPAQGEQYRVVSAEKLHQLSAARQKARQSARGSKRWNLFVLGLGGVIGIVGAGWFAQNNDMIDLPAIADINLDSIADILPAGLLQDARDLQVSFQVGSDLPFCFAAVPRVDRCRPPAET